MTVTVRTARTGSDLEDAFDVRRDVFVEEQGVPETEEMDGNDDDATHFVAYDDGRPVGTARIRTTDDAVGKVERVAVRRPYREAGVGTAIMDELEAWAAAQGLETLKLHSQTRVEGFYGNLGYETTSGVFREAGIDHVEMRKSLDTSA